MKKEKENLSQMASDAWLKQDGPHRTPEQQREIYMLASLCLKLRCNCGMELATQKSHKCKP